MRPIVAIACVAISLAAAKNIGAEEMPHINGETLSGKKLEFPSVTAGSVAIIFIGFSHASQSQLKAWTDEANKQLRNNAHVMIYDMAVLEDAPRFVRGMAVHGMKSGTPAAEYDRFAVVYQGEPELKRVTAFQRSDEAYILLLDPKGDIKWVSHGKPTDEAIKELTKQVEALLPK
ncbi:MAG TPA: hypothetical protein VH302_16810 [Bryobacteraceae bacterium]|nr:hypothetical protein [Bryobacteraceae bacterium]